MSIDISKLFEEAEGLADQRRLLPAVQKLEEARQLTKIPDRRALASYNLGAIHWHFLGDGLAARREFLAAITDFDAHDYGPNPLSKITHANALENAMLCALSFEEFEDLAARLAALTPGVPILTGLVPVVQNLREEGQPWCDCLFSFARSYYDRNDPQRDPGRYGEAKATYHLLLAHRRELRLSREDWGMAVFEYCALSMRMVSDDTVTRGDDHDPHSPDEFLPILTAAIPLVDEYLAANPGNANVEKTRRGMDQIVEIYRQRWVSLGSGNVIVQPGPDVGVKVAPLHDLTTFSALVTGLPPGIHGPEVRSGESQFQFLIRYHPNEWKNFVEWIGGKMGLSESERQKLIAQDAALLNRPQIKPNVAEWANLRVPVPWRTLHCLCELQSSLEKNPLNWTRLRLVQILWPREGNPSGDDSAETMASEMGAEVIRLPVGVGREELDLRPYIPMVRGRYLWMVPGGSRIMPIEGMSLHMIFERMDANSSLAVYSDGAYSMIYRLSALQFASERTQMPLTHSHLCAFWQRMDFTCLVVRDPEEPLCEIEKIYGGTYPFPKPPGRFAWLRKLLGG